MKTFFQAFCFVLICSVAATDSYADSYRVRGEVSYENGQAKWTRSIVSDVILGVPVILKQGEKTFSLVFVVEPPASDNYSVTASLLTNPKSTDGFSTTVLTQTYQSKLVGRENGPLEFETEQNGIRISGIIAFFSKR